MGKDYDKRQLKSINVENSVKDIDSKQGIVKFAFAAYGKPDSDGDIIHEGAYRKSYTERGPQATGQIKHFKWHDSRFAPGKLTEIFDQAGYGIAVSKIAPTTLGKDTLIEYEYGLITEHSHGLNQLNDRNKDENGYNHITDAFLWEVSSLNGWGAQPDTPLLDIKAIGSTEQLLQIMDTVNKYLSIGEFSDELLSKFEKKYKQLEILYKQITRPPDSTLNKGPQDDTLTIDYMKSALSNIFKN